MSMLFGEIFFVPRTILITISCTSRGLQAAFLRTDPASTKKTDNLTVFFVLLGSERVKAACRMLMKLTPYS